MNNNLNIKIMKQILEIEVPEGKKAIYKDNKIIFEDIIQKLPETWEEFCKLYPIKEEEYYIELNSIPTEVSIGERFDHDDKNILPSKKAAEAHLALMQLHQLRDCYRQNWKPDWKNNCQAKYCIEFSDYQYKIFKYFVSCRFLSFQSEDVAKKFLMCFKNLIKQAEDLI